LKLDRIETPRPQACAGSLERIPPPEAEAILPAAFGRRFTIFGDAEEEFDWGAPFSRTATATSAVAALPAANRRFVERGIVPTYLVDWPVAVNEASAAAFAAMSAVGECDVGAHLHPWVNPPHEEDVNIANSFAGTLPPGLEGAKLEALTERLTALAGRPPVAYRAGRYGIGPNSARILKACGYRLDVSVRSLFDYSSEGGPDFTHFPIHPYWVDSGLLELPLTTCLQGPLARWPALARSVRLRGPLARSGLLNRVPLTPEGVPLGEAKRAIEILLDRGHRLFSLSFHTPTVAPGHTPYVRDAADLDAFWAWWDGIFDLFAKHGVLPARSGEILAAAEGS
jgi:peptidoglycan/xylan/chitin deacetylase (PgdA/CDA1 family)